ncbi:MAG: hypothetical protein J5737_04215 [Bacteroidales bacterium]|nr:hypothetical protein [Bacteroidales bacterium]
MKKAFLLLLAGTMAFAACNGTLFPEKPSIDSDLKGETVDIAGIAGFRKLFVLNEGQMGSNNASLDMLRLSDASYITGVFKKMNPEEAAGLGDVGNDIAVIGDELWIAVNNSGIVDVLSAKDETEIAPIQVPMPRSLAYDNKYVYVSSWNGAVAVYGSDWSVDSSQSKNPTGAVYRIDRRTKKVEGSVEVGYQPEGLAVYNGKLYVANSGGISNFLPPTYAYDKTVSVIDTKTFKVEKSIDVEINLQKVYSDGKGNIYVTSFGNYYSVHSGLWQIKADGSVAKVSDYATYTAIKGDTVYCIGNENEFDYLALPEWKTWKCKAGAAASWTINLDGVNPYGLAALSDDSFVIADAVDYFNPGNVSLFVDGAKKWTVGAGICPGHFAIW